MSDTSGCHKGLSLVRRQLDRRLENRAFIHKSLLLACLARVFYSYHARTRVRRREDSGQNSKKCRIERRSPYIASPFRHSRLSQARAKTQSSCTSSSVIPKI